MFVRFRQRPNAGTQPTAVQAIKQCTGRCKERKGQRCGPGFRIGTGCPERPRCQWRIGTIGLLPYRLLASLIENRRAAGKVRQEHIADLGAIDGHMLLPFFEGIEPELANAARINLEQWFRASITARLAFWQQLGERLARLSNRLSADETAAIRQTINERIPQPTEAELAQLRSWDIADELERWQIWKTREVSDMTKSQRLIAEERAKIETAKIMVDGIDGNLAKMRQAIIGGDLNLIDQAKEIREDAYRSSMIFNARGCTDDRK